MGKIQDAINVSREQAQGAGLERRSASLNQTALRQHIAPVHLKNSPSLALDPNRMERCCLLPYVKDKGATNAYKLLRTRLLHRMRNNQWKSVMVTGTLPSDGKTTTAINLAIGASQDVSQAVLLVDMDLERKPMTMPATRNLMIPRSNRPALPMETSRRISSQRHV